VTATITPALTIKLFELTAGFYANGIVCPPLVALNKWASHQMTGLGDPAPANLLPAAIADAERAAPVNFTEAVEAALKSSPKGVSTSDLQAILAHHRETPSNIGSALGRLKRGGKAEKRDGLWFAIGAAAKPINGTIDRSIGGRRNRRQESGGPGGGEDAEQHRGGATG